MNPFNVATNGKGFLKAFNRIGSISKRYGLTSHKMDKNLHNIIRILNQYHAAATFPVPASTLSRNSEVIKKYQEHNIEFAVHGYYHIDHSQLSYEDQLSSIHRSKHVFQARDISFEGFRCPYLRFNENTLRALEESGFRYDCSQALFWDVLDEFETESILKSLDFYRALPANRYTSLPRFDNGIIRFPYCLPDDEAIVERTRLLHGEITKNIWLSILLEVHNYGELFTLGLHPERIDLCEPLLRETLEHASDLSPHVWFATLGEIAHWWRVRSASNVTITEDVNGGIHLEVIGPEGITILVRGLRDLDPSKPWDNIYKKVSGLKLNIKSNLRPFIAVSPFSPNALKEFLRQQGYIFEETHNAQAHPLFIDQRTFTQEEERSLIADIEEADFPLVKLGRWPYGARSALTVTGDIDALTIWDYGFRLLGK